jgi:hypothetical protein
MREDRSEFENRLGKCANARLISNWSETATIIPIRRQALHPQSSRPKGRKESNL